MSCDAHNVDNQQQHQTPYKAPMMAPPSVRARLANSNLLRSRPPTNPRTRSATTAASPGRRIAIIGGGLTGLTTAYRLACTQPPSTTITIYEASPRLGGWIRTDETRVDVGGVRGTFVAVRRPWAVPPRHEAGVGGGVPQGDGEVSGRGRWAVGEGSRDGLGGFVYEVCAAVLEGCSWVCGGEVDDDDEGGGGSGGG
ncbi:hypothetical protein CDD80_3910 [Ophiocordyceps camponoti-rufipedis]|uniref:Amine oxidase domain-containing protein n=1 Tax=Ophiocordyceps camponoti-rufipedis TaxID=2004952 RepID=A0A2C5Z0Y6_9HYPO|nr:hypothetical protein CDD80_3910 [Ophiocordyceps camponoti-rufipedis]